MNGWDIAAGLANLAARLPIERFFTRNSTKDLEAFEQRLRAKGLLASETKSSAGGQNPSKIASQGLPAPSVPTLQQLQKSSKGKECRPCTADHLSTCAGVLSEGIRFAQSDGIESDEVQERLALCASELNAWQRWDAAPKSFVDLPDEDKDFLRRWMPRCRSLRHEVNSIHTMEDLEKTAAHAQRLHLEARKELRARPKSPLAEKFETEMGEHFIEGALKPNITLDEAKAEAAKLAADVVEKRWGASSNPGPKPPRLVGPRERGEVPEKLEFFADSRDHIEHSMNRNDLLPEVEQAFQEAIRRARRAPR